MFAPNEFISLCNKNEIKPKKWAKFMRAYFKNKDFYGWLFNPSKDQLTDYNNLVEKMYGGLCEDDKKIRVIVDLIEENPRDYGRSTAAFLYSVVNYGVDIANTSFKLIDQQYASGELDRKAAERKRERVEEYQTMISELNDALLSIIKRDAKRLSNETGLPKAICKMALKQVPDPLFITSSKVGIYLNMILSNLYTDIDTRETDVEDIKWQNFFDTVFGKEARYDVASFILLETPKHIESLTSKRVRRVWDSLTAFALRVLEKADDNSRSHTLEIYLKRLSRSLDSSENDVRVDLRSISEHEYPNLTKTVYRYKDKFDELFRPFNAASLLD